MTRRRERAPRPVGTRRAAREFVFRALFEAERGNQTLEAAFTRAEGAMRAGDDTFVALSDEALVFAHELMASMKAHQDEIDQILRRTIRGWTFDQMAQTDLNILRLATLEMMFTSEPHPPVIESAVRIARKFGGEDSGKFVNGVLGGLSRSLMSAPAVPPPSGGEE